MSILTSKLTWTILQEDLQKSLKTTGKFGPNKSAVKLGETTGFLSEIALITFDWIDNMNGLPEKAVVKMSSCGEFTGVSSKLEQEVVKITKFWLGDNEFDAYFGENPASILFSSFPKAKFYAGRRYTNYGYIAIEYFEENRGTTRRLFDSTPDEIIYQGVDLIAELTIKSLKNPSLVKKWCNTSYKTVLEDHCQLQRIKKRLLKMREMYPKCLETIEYLWKKTDELKDFEKTMRNPEIWCDQPILCHGDMWTPNIVCSNGEKPRIEAILDWQLVHIGTPTKDLVFLFFSALPAEEYANRFHIFLHYFYEKLVDEFDLNILPWKSFQQLLEEYERMYAHISFMMFTWFTEAKSALLKGREKDEAKFDAQILSMAKEVERCLKKWF